MHSVEKKIYLGLLVCLLVSIVGTSFAYFVSSTAILGEGGKTDLSTADLIGVKYDAGSSSINIENITPGTGKEKDFSVTVTPTNSQKTVTYAVAMNIVSNTFVKCNDDTYDANSNACVRDSQELVYTLSDNEGNVLKTGDLLETTGMVEIAKFTKTVEDATTFDYKLNITFVNTNNDQNHNTNKEFEASLKVEFAEAD